LSFLDVVEDLPVWRCSNCKKTRDGQQLPGKFRRGLDSSFHAQRGRKRAALRWQVFDGARHAEILIGFIKRLMRDGGSRAALHESPRRVWLRPRAICRVARPRRGATMAAVSLAGRAGAFGTAAFARAPWSGLSGCWWRSMALTRPGSIANRVVACSSVAMVE